LASGLRSVAHSEAVGMELMRIGVVLSVGTRLGD
jgi:hypothetical protein